MAACSIEDYKVVAKSDDKLSQIKEISAEELKNWIEKKSTSTGSPFFLIDTLPKESFNYQHLPSAVNADLHSMQKEFLDNVNEIVSGNKEANIIVYCSGGDCPTSDAAALKLVSNDDKRAGFKNVILYKGGLEEWEKLNFPFEGNQ